MEKVGLQAVITNMGQFRAAGNEIDRTFDSLGGKSERAAGRMSKLGDIAKTAIGFAVGTVAVSAIKSLTSGLVGLVASAAPLVDMENAFNKLSASYNINSQQMIESMRSASKGTIADSDLIQSANKALIGSGEELGKQFGEALPRLLEMARASAKATGQDVGFLFESLVTGIKRGSPMIIDNTGLQLKLSEAYQATADSLGIAVEEMSAEQKQIALLNATLEAGVDMVEAMGDEQLTTAELMAQMRAQTKNLKNEIAKAFVPIMAKLLKRYLIPFSKLLKRVLVPWAKRFADAIDTVADVFDAFFSGMPADFPWEDILPEWLADIAYKVAKGFELVRDAIRALRSGAPSEWIANAWYEILPEWAYDRAMRIALWVEELFKLIKSFRAGGFALFPWGKIFPDWLARRLYALPAALEGAREGVRGFLDTIRTEGLRAIVPKLSETLSKLNEWIGGVVEWIGKQPSKIAEAMAEWGPKITEWLDEHMPGAELTAEQMGFLTPSAEEALKDREGRPWWRSIADGIIIGWDNVLTTVEAKAAEYQERFSKALFGWLQVEEVWEDASALGPTYTSGLLARLADWFATIADWIGRVGVPTLLGVLEGIGTKIIELIFPLMRKKEIQPTMTPLEKAIIEGFREIGGKSADAFAQGFADAMAPGIAKYVPEEEFLGMVERGEVMEIPSFRTPAEWLPIIGKGLADIFKNLFADEKTTKPALDEASAFGIDLGANVIQGTRGELETESASQVYLRIGQEVAEGLGLGIKDPLSVIFVSNAITHLIDRSRSNSLPYIVNVARDMASRFVNAFIGIVQAGYASIPAPPSPPGWVTWLMGASPPPAVLDVQALNAELRQTANLLTQLGGAPMWNVPVPAVAPVAGATYQTTNVWSPSVSAAYQQAQSPGSVMQDLETLAILYRMG